MWNKEKTLEETQTADATSFFSKEFRLLGDIETENDVRIEGTVEGNIKTSKKVIVGITGSVIGNVNATNIHLMGEISGDIYTSGLASIGETAKISGTITAHKLSIEPGATVEATIKRFSSTTPGQPRDKTVMKEINKIDKKSGNFHMTKAK
jgi:cytoskeletal protein CcmA (bactofilin family)